MRLGVLLLVLLTGSIGWAEWEAWTPTMLIAKSDLIGTGSLLDLKRTQSNATVNCEGAIRLDELLKGTNAVAVLRWGFGIPPIEDSTDHTSLEGKRLLWFLRENKDGSFSVPHKDGVQNISRTAEFKAIIETRRKTGLAPGRQPDETVLKRLRKGMLHWEFEEAVGKSANRNS